MMLTRRKGVESRNIGDGAVLVDTASGACFELNRTGTEIWELLAGGATEQSICEALAHRYAVGDEALCRDVRNVLDAMMQNHLIEGAT